MVTSPTTSIYFAANNPDFVRLRSQNLLYLIFWDECAQALLFCFSTMQRVGLGTRLYMCHWNRPTQDTDWPLCPDLCVWHSLSQAQAEKLLIEGQSAIERMCAWLYVRVFPTHFIGTFLLLILYVATASVSLLPSLHLSLPSTSPSPPPLFLSLHLFSSFALLLFSVAELKADAARIELETELECQTQSQEAEIQFLREQNELEILKAKELSSIEVSLRIKPSCRTRPSSLVCDCLVPGLNRSVWGVTEGTDMGIYVLTSCCFELTEQWYFTIQHY